MPGAPIPLPLPGSPSSQPPGFPQAAPLPGQTLPPGQPGQEGTAMPAPPGAAAAPGASAVSPEAGAGEPTPSLLIAAPLAAKTGTEVLVSIGIPPGTPAVSARMELSYDPTQLEPVGAAVSAQGRLPLKVDGSAAVRFKILAPQGRTQVRVDSLVGLDAAGGSTPISPPAPIDVTITP